MGLRARVRRLEQSRGHTDGWRLDLRVWRRERAEGISLEEQERRRLAEHPEAAPQIRACFAQWRQRRAALDAVSEDVSDKHDERDTRL